MSETKIPLASLDTEERHNLFFLAKFCCETGEAPLQCFGKRSLEKQSLFKNEEFNQLVKAAQRLGKEFGRSDFDAFPPSIGDAIALVNCGIREMHLELLVDPSTHEAEIRKRSQNLADLLIRNGDDSGLILVRDLRPKSVPNPKLPQGLQFFNHEGKAIYIAPAKVGAINASYPLAMLLCRAKSISTLKVRPDAYRILDVEHAAVRLERAATYGRQFDRGWLKDLRGTTIAQHDPDPDNFSIRGETVQFIWERLDGDEIQFSVEELPNFQSPQDIEKINVTRFIHGIYNVKLECFNHFDGAVHIYSEDEYRHRLTLNLKDHFNSYKKAKIFRIDEHVTFPQAEALLADFFRWNDLVPEYFTPQN